MSNICYVVGTIFRNQHEIEESYGVRIFDDYGKDYCNTFESLPDNDLELLRLCVQYGVGMQDGGPLDSVTYDSHKGIEINDTWYDWEEIGHILLEESREDFLANLKEEKRRDEKRLAD